MCLNIIVYTSTKSWRGYIFIAVCLCVCLSVSEQNSNQTDAQIWMRFSLDGNLRTGSNPIEIGDPVLKIKVTVIENVTQNDEKKIH